jgi:vesicle-fusing ATPase
MLNHSALKDQELSTLSAMLLSKLISCKRKRKKINNFLHLTIIDFYFLRFRTTTEAYDSDQMAKEFLMQFAGLAITVGQPMVFSFADKKLLGVNIKSIEAMDAKAIRDGTDVKPAKINFGKLTGNAVIQFEKAENSALNLVGKAKG